MSEKLNTIKQQLRRMLETIDNCEEDGANSTQNGSESRQSEPRQNDFNLSNPNMSANSSQNASTTTSRTFSSTSQSQSTGGGFASRAVENFR